MASFWLISSGMVFMTVTLTFAGVLQTHLERVNGGRLHGRAGPARPVLLDAARLGVVTVIGVLLFIYAILVPRVKCEAIASNKLSPAPAE